MYTKKITLYTFKDCYLGWELDYPHSRDWTFVCYCQPYKKVMRVPLLLWQHVFLQQQQNLLMLAERQRAVEPQPTILHNLIVSSLLI